MYQIADCFVTFQASREWATSVVQALRVFQPNATVFCVELTQCIQALGPKDSDQAQRSKSPKALRPYSIT
jgi:hypothetical protein